MANPQNATGTLVTESAPRQLSDGNSVGTVLGQSPTDLVGFFGQTAVQQPGSVGSLRGAAGTVTIYATTQSPTSVAANTAAEQTITVTGVATGQLVVVNKPTSQAGLALCAARVSAANTVALTFGNDTAAAITPTATETYFVTAIPATMLLTPTLSPPAIAPNTSFEYQVAVTGVSGSAAVQVNKPTAQAGLGVTGARSISPSQLGITFTNFTAATITPTAGEVYKVYAQSGISIAPVQSSMSTVLAPTSVAANTTAEQTFTVPNLPAGTAVIVNKGSSQPGISIGGARVSAANTLAITYVNNTANAIVPATEAYDIGVFPTAAPAAGSSTAFNAEIGGSTAYGALVSLGLIAGP